MTNAYDIIIKPVLTEKSYDHLPDKVYTFIVDKRASRRRSNRLWKRFSA